MDPFTLLAATAATYLLAGFVKGVIGLGLPTVAVGVLGLMMSPAQAAAIVVLPSLVTNVWQFMGGGALGALVRRLAPMLLGICAGTFVAALWLPNLSSADATVWLGVALALYAALGLLKIHLVVRPSDERWLGPAIGAVTGAVTVATGVFVIPAVPYITALGLERGRLVQALGLSFTVSTVTLAAALYHAGAIRMSVAWPSLIALLVALIGMMLGQIVRGKVQPKTFRLCFFVGLLLLGAHLALHRFL